MSTVTAPAPTVRRDPVEPPVDPAARDGLIDGVTVLSLIIAILFLLPSRLKFAPLGGMGAPATLLGLAALGWWVLYHLARTRPANTRRQPVRIWVTIFASCLMASYVASTMRPFEYTESATSVLGLIQFASWGGILLLAHDGITSTDRWLQLLRRLVMAGAFIASVGVLQFITHQQLVDKIHIPGLTVTQSYFGLGLRSGFNRPSGTALHAIEFGAVVTMLLPLAINMAIYDKSRSWLARWYPVGVMGFAISISISRTAIIGAVVGVIVLMPKWPPAVRLAALVIAPVVCTFLFVTVPGLLGALAGMFTGIDGDEGAQSRVDAVPVAFDFISRSPFVGRGISTFLPSYHILDNQWLLLLIEAGFVGTLALLACLLAAMAAARRAARTFRDERQRQLAWAIFAGVCVGTVSIGFYDGFSFPLASCLLFLLVGIAGASRRLALEVESRDGADGADVADGAHERADGAHERADVGGRETAEDADAITPAPGGTVRAGRATTRR